MDDPTDRDIESQRVQIVVVSEVGAAVAGIGTGILFDPAGGVVVGAAAAPLLNATLERIFGFRRWQIDRMLEFAEEAAGQELEALLRQATADPNRTQLFSSAVRAAANTALESKLKVLGRLLVQGLLHDDQAQVDEARLLTVAIEEVERLHLRVLSCLTQPYDAHHSDEERARADAELPAEAELPPDAWAIDRLKDDLGVTRSAVEMVIGTLSGRNLIHGGANTYGTPRPRLVQWALTEPGKAVLARFREAGEEAAQNAATPAP